VNTLQSIGGFTTNYVTNANGTVTITSMTKLVSFRVDLRVAIVFLAIVGIAMAYVIFAHRRSGSN
jgi:hypothetical protein